MIFLYISIFILVISFTLLLRSKAKYKYIICEIRKREEKYRIFFDLSQSWIYGLQNNRDIGKWLNTHGYKTVAIYGAGEFGQLLYDHLKDKENIVVKYVIDKTNKSWDIPVQIQKPEQDLPKVDIVIVTAIFSYDEIKKSLEKKMNCKIISLTQMIENMYIDE